ncbi:unnamed protein product [Malus baccata var. baccata]
MSKFTHETKGCNAEFHEWYNMEPPPLSGSLKANPMPLFSSKHQGHIESYEYSQEGNAKMEEECNKGFEDSCQLVKGKESRQP